MKKLLFGSLSFIVLSGISSCVKNNPVSHYIKQQKVQAAVDKVRKDLSDSLDISVPSLNVLIQTPTDEIFVSSAATPEQSVTANTYYRFASNTKNFTAVAVLIII